MVIGSFWLFCLATLIGGIYAAVVLSFRFAAADCVAPERRPRMGGGGGLRTMAVPTGGAVAAVRASGRPQASTGQASTGRFRLLPQRDRGSRNTRNPSSARLAMLNRTPEPKAGA